MEDKMTEKGFVLVCNSDGTSEVVEKDILVLDKDLEPPKLDDRVSAIESAIIALMGGTENV
jgi:hypothetical protein